MLLDFGGGRLKSLLTPVGGLGHVVSDAQAAVAALGEDGAVAAEHLARAAADGAGTTRYAGADALETVSMCAADGSIFVQPYLGGGAVFHGKGCGEALRDASCDLLLCLVCLKKSVEVGAAVWYLWVFCRINVIASTQAVDVETGARAQAQSGNRVAWVAFATWRCHFRLVGCCWRGRCRRLCFFYFLWVGGCGGCGGWRCCRTAVASTSGAAADWSVIASIGCKDEAGGAKPGHF